MDLYYSTQDISFKAREIETLVAFGASGADIIEDVRELLSLVNELALDLLPLEPPLPPPEVALTKKAKGS